MLDRIVMGYAPDEIREVLRSRLAADLCGPLGEILLGLVESYATEDLYERLADALEQSAESIDPQRCWVALEILQGSGLIEARPTLAELWDEFADLVDEGETSLGQLASLIEEDSEGLWTALHGLGRVEPEVRAELISGLADQPVGPGLIEFLRLLALCPEPTTSRSALDALAGRLDHDPGASVALAYIAAKHRDPMMAARIASLVPDRARSILRETTPDLIPRPRLVACRLSGLDSRGRGMIGLASEEGDHQTAASFYCSLRDGILDVVGLVPTDPREIEAFLREATEPAGHTIDPEDHARVLDLLASALTRCGPATTPALWFWIERTAGPAFRPSTFEADSPGDQAAEALPLSDLARRARDVLDALPGWVDESDATYEIAEELLLREGGSEPDPIRDSGALRYLFETQLRHRVDLDRRMLGWMTVYWRASGAEDLARSAAVLVSPVADAQNNVPGHPYFIELAMRSLASAQNDLRWGVDLRDPIIRTRRAGIERM